MNDAAATFFELAARQRAHRWFEPGAEVPDADLRRMLAAATRAPSAENQQPWTFVVVRDPSVRAAIAEVARARWRTGGRAHAERRIDAEMLADLDASIDAGFGGAPVLVVVAGDASTVHPAALASSLYPAVQNLLLAAAALGYGSALTTLATVGADDLRAVVGLPPEQVPVAVVPIGRPLRRLGRSRRRPVGEVAHRDRYGDPFP